MGRNKENMKDINNRETRKYLSKALIFTIAPFLIPLIALIPENILNTLAKVILIFLMASIDVVCVIKSSLQDANEVSLLKKRDKYRDEYKILKQIFDRVLNCEKIKEDFIKDGMGIMGQELKGKILFYDVHKYLERICEELKTLISSISGIELEYISVSFIYKYPIFENDKWKGWKWITENEPTAQIELRDIINNTSSYYHYLISNNMATHFENDKNKLVPDRYFKGERDLRHKESGSISAHKMSFSKNNEIYCQGYLKISTYGRKFFDENNEPKFQSEKEFEIYLFDKIIPPFRKMIETELGFMYLEYILKRDKMRL